MDFFIYKDNKQQGPYTLGQLAGMGLSSETLVWCEGMAQWTPAWQVAELRGVLSGTYKAAAAPPTAPTQAAADGDGGAAPQAEGGQRGGDPPTAQAAQRADKRHRRAAAWLAAAAAAFFILLMTCPGAEKHRRAVADEISAAMTEEAYDRSAGGGMLGMFGGMVGGMIATQFADAVVSQLLSVDDYFIFSIGKVRYGGKEKTVSFGILGHVFTFDSADLRKALDDNTPVPDTMAV